MNRLRRRRGFTIIELMVTLVVAGLLMAVLVGISGSVQRSFGRSKDIIELQSNLRFAMKTLVNDFSRASYMTSPDPGADLAHHVQALPSTPSIDNAAGVFMLRGNFTSSRDYLIYINSSTNVSVLCRNKFTEDPVLGCGSVDGVDAQQYVRPFGDGPDFLDVFCAGTEIRLDREDRYYEYHTVANPVAGTLSFDMVPPLNRDADGVKGFYKWVNPITTVSYQVMEDAGYAPIYTSAGDNHRKWVLQRTYNGCQAGAIVATTVDIAEFLLPQSAPRRGFEVQEYRDTAMPGLGVPPWQPAIAGPNLVAVDNQLNISSRAVMVTLRGRTEAEDPAFQISAYPAGEAMEFGYDLNDSPQDGLAYVRVERTVIELRNLGINLNM